MNKNIHFLEVSQTRKEEDSHHFLTELASLRMSIFREFPYLYEGTLDYEKKYLKTYFSCTKSFILFALDNDKIIGATTAIILSAEEENFQRPFIEINLDPSQICYFGESLLLSNYRGLGIGKKFMHKRLDFANRIQMKKASFCSVIRQANHPLRPLDYKPLDPFWIKEGFKKIDGLVTTYSWKDLDGPFETEKKMQFWMKDL